MKKTVMVINRRDSGVMSAPVGDVTWIDRLHQVWRIPPSRRLDAEPPTQRRLSA